MPSLVLGVSGIVGKVAFAVVPTCAEDYTVPRPAQIGYDAPAAHDAGLLYVIGDMDSSLEQERLPGSSRITND